MKLYMAVTPDEYELPMFVTEDLQQMADKFNITKQSISQRINKKLGGRVSGVKFVKVEVDYGQ